MFPPSLLKLLPSLILLALVSSACKREQPAPGPLEAPKTSPPRVLLTEPVSLEKVELASEALPVWRQFAARKPVLLLLSGDPLLTPVPDIERAAVQQLATSGAAGEIFERSRPWTANPLFLPGMTVDVALRAGWFAQFVWALPIPDPALPLSGEVFLRQMHEGGFLDHGEGIGFGVSDNRLRGVLRQTSFVAAALSNLPALPSPVVVHIDPSYFQALYRNEKETPLIPLVAQTLQALQSMHLSVLAVTFSCGNLDQRLPLDLRVVGELVAEYLQDPGALGRQDLERKPSAVSTKYRLYRTAMETGDGAAAMNHLREAVRLDSVHALEYLALAGIFVDAGKEKDGLRMLALAQEAFPDNLNIQLLAARLAIKGGERQVAADLLEQLQRRAWSETYFPEMPEHLAHLARELRARGER